MRNIGRNIRRTVKQGNSFPATVTDIQNNRVTVRLSGNGALYRSIKLVGGPVTIGQQVMVDFTTNEPTVVAPGVAVNIPTTNIPRRAARPRAAPETEPLRPMGDAIWITDPLDAVVGSAVGYPITNAGLSEALSKIYEFQREPGYDQEVYTLWIPTGTFDMSSIVITEEPINIYYAGVQMPQRTRMIGMGAANTIFSGGHICFDNQFDIQDIGFQVAAAYSPTGVEDEYYEHVTVRGDGTFDRCSFSTTITGTGKGICLGNAIPFNCVTPENAYADVFPTQLVSWGANISLYDCTFESSHYGIYFNRIREGYGGVQYFPFCAPAAMPPTTVELTDSSGSSGSTALDPSVVQWMHFKPVTVPSGENVDGFAIGIVGRRYENAGAKVYLEIEIGSGELGCADMTSWNSTNTLDLAPRMDTTDCLLDIYDPPEDHVADFTARMMSPTIPTVDQGGATFVNGNAIWFRVQEGDLVTWRFDNMNYGLGSDWDDTLFSPYPDSLPWDAETPSVQEMFVAHFNRGYGAGSPARYEQAATEFYARVSRCYVLFPDGYKIYLAPSRVRAELHTVTITAGTKRIEGKNAEVLTDNPSLVGESEITHLYNASNLVVSPDQPSVGWPGRMWFQTGG